MSEPNDKFVCARAADLMRVGAEKREAQALAIEARSTHNLSQVETLHINALRLEASTLRYAAAIIVKEDR